MTQHIASSLGNEHCVALLLEYGANPNIKGGLRFTSIFESHGSVCSKRCGNSYCFFYADPEGATPLWDAIMGKHDHVIKLLTDNGAKLTSGDVGNYACIAAGQNNLDLLNDIIKYGGDVTLPNYCGTTALHAAVSEGNIEIVKFLVNRGANMDKPDIHGWTPMDLAEHQSHEEITALFLTKQKKTQNLLDTSSKTPPLVDQSPPKRHVSYLPKYNSEPVITPHFQEKVVPAPETSPGASSHVRRRNNSFQNSLFGLLSSMSKGIAIFKK